MASASPITKDAVALAVGAILNGQASLDTLTLRTTSEDLPRVDLALLVIATICTVKRFIAGSKLTSSSVSPE